MAVNPADITFVKNSNAREPYTLAYAQYLMGASFDLEFANKPDVSRISAGDVVLLYQTVQHGILLLTHLVRIVNPTVKTNNDNKDYPYSLTVQVAGKIPDGVDRKYYFACRFPKYKSVFVQYLNVKDIWKHKMLSA